MGERHERLFLLAFQKVFFHNPRVGKRLIEAFGSERAAFEASEWDLMPHFGAHEDLFRCFKRFDGWSEMEASLRVIDSVGGRLMSYGDDSYPFLLKAIYDPPPVITVIGGGVDVLALPAVAIVGARKSTRHGRDIAAELSEGLAASGIVVVSGMAYGIDAAAHRGALLGGGPTIAVLGCGPDITYPPSNRVLSDEIRRDGLIVTEFPAGELPHPSNFPQRNRVISGLALATVVVEAAAKSGSLITARFALEQGREVMAVPGSAGTPLARGTNRLVRDGATLVESPEDIIEVLQPLVKTMCFPERAGHFKNDVDKDSQLFRALKAPGGRSFDELVESTGLTVQSLSEELAHMMMDGLVTELPGRRWRLKERDG